MTMVRSPVRDESSIADLKNKTRNISGAEFHSRIKTTVQRIILGAALLFSLMPVAYAEAVIPGLATSQLDPELKGLVLIEELNCAACHTSDAPFAARFQSGPTALGRPPGPNFGRRGGRLRAKPGDGGSELRAL